MTDDEAAEMQDIGLTFSTASGQRTLDRWVRRFVYSLSYAPGDPSQTLVNEGRKEFVLGIVRNLELYRDPATADVVVVGGPED